MDVLNWSSDSIGGVPGVTAEAARDAASRTLACFQPWAAYARKDLVKNVCGSIGDDSRAVSVCRRLRRRDSARPHGCRIGGMNLGAVAFHACLARGPLRVETIGRCIA